MGDNQNIIDAICDLYSRGRGTDEVADAFNVTPDVVRYVVINRRMPEPPQ